MFKKVLYVFKNLPKLIIAHKLISGIIILIVLIGGYFGFKALGKSEDAVKYIISSVEKGTLIVSVSGSGQVSAKNQIDVKPKVSGDVVYVGVRVGQEVKEGTLLAQLDATDARKAVRDAEIALENSQITLSKLKVSQGNSVSSIEDSIESAESNLEQAYQNGFNAVVNSFLDTPTILEGTRGILYDTDVASPDTKMNTAAYQDLVVDSINSTTVSSMISKSLSEYVDALSKYNKNLTDYRNASRFSSPEEIVVLIEETLETIKTMAQLVKDEQNLIDTVVSTLQYRGTRTIPGTLTQYQSDISGYIGKLNSHISNLSSVVNTIESNQKSLETYQRNLGTAIEDNPLDLRSQENAVEQKKDALQDAKDTLADYYVRASFDGVIASLDVEKGDTVSSGTTLVTLITEQQVAVISLNEVDIAQVKVGQKVNLTFDAVADLTISGEVLEVDSVGTTTQSVVTYDVTIGFDTQDERIKSGMSVSAVIITQAKQDVLMVSNSAVKTSGEVSYVEMPGEEVIMDSLSKAGIALNSIIQQQVEVGLSNDSYTEIISGLEEGNQVILRTTGSSSSSSSLTGNSSERGFMMMQGGGPGR